MIDFITMKDVCIHILITHPYRKLRFSQIVPEVEANKFIEPVFIMLTYIGRAVKTF